MFIEIEYEFPTSGISQAHLVSATSEFLENAGGPIDNLEHTDVRRSVSGSNVRFYLPLDSLPGVEAAGDLPEPAIDALQSALEDHFGASAPLRRGVRESESHTR